MTLLQFGIVLLIILAALYIINYAWTTAPNIIRVIVNIVAAFVILFMVLALFHLMPLPFSLK